MIEFWIADLMSEETVFSVPCSLGAWEFQRRADYVALVEKMEEGQCAPTYYASNEAIIRNTPDDDVSKAISDMIDTCLILSFINACCVTVRGTTGQSDAQFIQLGDQFIRPRAIRGFRKLDIQQSFANFFARGFSSISQHFDARRVRLFLSHWISGLTCFSMEDLFLSIGVQMDIVKQCEIVACDRSLTYYDGMVSASTRYGIAPISDDYKKMRNDIVHYGSLSSRNFANKNKEECSVVIADSLNWIDKYVSSILGITPKETRWRAKEIENSLPALSII
ncbi:hypothetical protein SAMN02745216_04257 [Desulfatibacillum alkenivorans DSM 16219]|jgi:hypothetical protein|uniref:Apea-like HEPN domain-containing protein n=1 Tax=Desulfatibacillum alkenivorans DSM 16219 TaxID=1121393 RepID=A0A1M6W5W9_9BACT|nr:hypothetical protein [Desulfatibacillum alkenivorans]SHK89123.1 hypothetical protein SAMN02745216_04257 [Desulfatibacillum alkenivorans DSM 16219]